MNEEKITQTRGNPRKKMTFSDVMVINGDVSFDVADYDQNRYSVKQSKPNSPFIQISTPTPRLVEKRLIYGICFNCKKQPKTFEKLVSTNEI